MATPEKATEAQRLALESEMQKAMAVVAPEATYTLQEVNGRAIHCLGQPWTITAFLWKVQTGETVFPLLMHPQTEQIADVLARFDTLETHEFTLEALLKYVEYCKKEDASDVRSTK